MNRRGFTLIELLIYIVLFAITASALSSAYVSGLATDELARRTQVLVETRRNAGILIRETVRSAGAVTVPANGSGNILTVDGQGVDDGPVTFSWSDGALFMQTATTPATAVTPSDVTVTEFTVTRVSGSPPGVSVRLVLEAQGGNAVLTEETEFIVTLRYE